MYAVWYDKPQALCFKNLGRGFQRRDGEQPVARCGAFFVAGNKFGYAQAATANQHTAQGCAFDFFKDVRFFIAACARKPRYLGSLGHNAGAGGVHFVNHIAAATVQVHRAGVCFLPGAKAVHRANDLAVLILNGKGLARAAQIHMPLRALAGGQQLCAVGRLQQQALGVKSAGGGAGSGTCQHGIARGERYLCRRAFQMAGKDNLVVGIDHGLFGRAVEKIFGIAGKILVQRVLARHHNNGRFLLGAAHAATALQGGHDRAGVAHKNAHVEPANVYAQLKRAGAHHGQQLARGHAGLDAAAFFGQKTRAVGRNMLGKSTRLPCPQADKLGHAP